MASITTPRYFVAAARKGRPYYQWQPPGRKIALGWKTQPLTGATGEPSPLAQAIAQANWLNEIHDAMLAGNQALAHALVAAWAADTPDDLGAAGESLSLCPFIAYRIPGLGQPRQPKVARSCAELFARYRKSLAFTNLRHRTRLDYAGYLRTFETLLGQRPVARMTRKPLLELYEALIKRHGRASANYRMRVLSAALSHAVDLEWLPLNPMLRFNYLPTRGRIRVASEAELQALMDAARTLGRPDGLGLLAAAAFTGQRRADVCELLRSQYENRCFALDQQKRGSFVRVEAVDELVTAIDEMLAAFHSRWDNLDRRFAELKLRQPRAWFRHMPSTPLLWNVETGLPLDKYSATRLFAAMRQAAAASLPSVASLQLRDMRDFTVTELFRAGCSDAEVAAITGHGEQSIGMKRKHYVDRHDNVIAAHAAAKLRARRNALRTPIQKKEA